jgi:hypothetical protein
MRSLEVDQPYNIQPAMPKFCNLPMIVADIDFNKV